MGNYWTNPVRHPEDTGIQFVRRTVTFNMTDTGNLAIGSGNGIPIGALEAGTIPLYCHVTIEAAFNAGTTNVFVVGTVDDDDGFAVAASTLSGATGFKGNLTGALTGIPLAADKVVYAKYTQTGTAGTTGKAEVVMTFAVKRENIGTAWPNN
jgi:hypothetical protein